MEMVVGREVLQKPDEKDLIPFFSNATASRSFHGRKARRSQRSGMVSPFATSLTDSDGEGEE